MKRQVKVLHKGCIGGLLQNRKLILGLDRDLYEIMGEFSNSGNSVTKGNFNFPERAGQQMLPETVGHGYSQT